MRGMAGSAAAPAARRKNARRGNFMMLPSQCATSRTCNPSGRAAGVDYTSCEKVEGVNASSWHLAGIAGKGRDDHSGQADVAFNYRVQVWPHESRPDLATRLPLRADELIG